MIPANNFRYKPMRELFKIYSDENSETKRLAAAEINARIRNTLEAVKNGAEPDEAFQKLIYD